MALIKSTTLPSGITGEYWKLTSFAGKKSAGGATAAATLSLFKDAQHASSEPIGGASLSFKFEFTDQELVGNMPALLYQKIKDKNHPTLDGAVDG
jgi:hypothetical protein